MFGPGRGRDNSLVDIPGMSSVPDAAEGVARNNTGGLGFSSRSVPDVNADSDMEYGIGLLVFGSPIGDTAECDDTLLDYDSDKTTTQQQIALQSTPGQSSLVTEPHSWSTNAAIPSMPVSTVILDAMYHQCRASRLIDHRDILVSISPDSTFGKRIVSQSVPIGTFEDHTGIENTFHGSRIL